MIALGFKNKFRQVVRVRGNLRLRFEIEESLECKVIGFRK